LLNQSPILSQEPPIAHMPVQIAPVSTPDTEAIMTATTPITTPLTAQTTAAFTVWWCVTATGDDYHRAND
jgi:hypothetical protein